MNGSKNLHLNLRSERVNIDGSLALSSIYMYQVVG